LRTAAPELSPAAEALLTTREWPGNVRELFHVVQRASLLARSEAASQLGAHHFTPGATDAAAALSFHDQTREFQKALLRRTLEDNGHDVAQTAARLDLARSYVYKLMTAHGLGQRT